MKAVDSSPPTTKHERWLTPPNLITSLRVVGSPLLVVLAYHQQPMAVAGLVALLVFTEWLDGALARMLHQQSTLGARLDTLADASFYSSLLISLVLLYPELMSLQAAWMAAAIGSYALSWLAALIKFRSLPSYHTWMAKGAWLVVGMGTIALVAEWSIWLFRTAMLCVVVANLEAVAITCLLARPRVDVPTLWHAYQLRKHP